jgi:uncharacterized protein
MRVRLEQVRDNPYRWDETVSVDAAEIEHPDLRSLSPVRWRGEIRFVDPGYLLTASYSYQQTLSCQRCLEPVAQTVEEPMHLLFLPGAQPPAAPEHALAEEELGVVEVEEDAEVELMPLLLEQIQLNVPMKPLCRPDCAGLCPKCGARLDEGPCGCSQDDIDPRWEALRALQERKKN